MLSDIRYRLRALFHRGRLDADLEDELRHHLEQKTRKHAQRGLPPAAARRRALLGLGGMEQVRQQTREARGIRLLQQLRQDVLYSLRSLHRNRTFAAAFILTLSLGIGSCTAVFSLMRAVLFSPVPYGRMAQLVYITTPNRSLTGVPLDAVTPDNADFADLARENHSFSSMTQFAQRTLKLEGTALSLNAAAVDANFFATLQSRPALGRAIDDRDNQQGSAEVAVISRSLRQQLFGADSQVLGKPLRLDGRTYRVIGVMAAGFRYPRKTELDYGNKHIDGTDVWIPLSLTPAQRADRGMSGDCYALARLRPGVSAPQAQAELSALLRPLDPLHTPPAFQAGWYASVKPFTQTLEGSARPVLLLLLGAVFFVLLIACGNSANLLLARSASRTHELGLRAALGAGRVRLIRQMLTESLLLSLGGGLAGTGLAVAFLRVLRLLDPGDIPRLKESSLDGAALGFAVALTLLSGVLAGILPALLASCRNLLGSLRAGGQTGAPAGRYRLSSALVVGEVAVVVVLLTGAGLLLRSLLELNRVPLGFSSTTLSMKLELSANYTSSAQRQAFYRTLLAQLAAAPGITATGAVTNLPLGDSKSVGFFQVEGSADGADQAIDGMSVTPGYFSAMGIALETGRAFSLHDEDDAHSVVVNQAFVDRYFPGSTVLGRHLLPTDPAGALQPQNRQTIIGVVNDVRDWSLEAPPQPQLYQPFHDADSAYLVIRSILPRAAIAASADIVLHRLDRGLAFSQVHSMAERVSEATARRRFQTVLLAVFAAMALALAMVGFYGLLAYTVVQREAEMGIRLALGATRAHIMRLILRQGLRLVSIGLILGLAGSFMFTRLLRSFLYQVSALDPATFAAVPALFLLVALAACLVPARRAAVADPMAALRRE